jgi:hypothetical protein
MKYISFILVSLVILVARAFLVPILHLPTFALEPETSPTLLPVFKDKVEDAGADPSSHRRGHVSSSSGSAATRYLSARFASSPRTRSPSESLGSVADANGKASSSQSPAAATPSRSSSGRHKHAKGASSGKWGWVAARHQPKIEIGTGDDFYDGGKSRSSAFQWRPASGARSRSTMGIVGRELWTTVWRVAWMVVCFWGYLAYKG